MKMNPPTKVTVIIAAALVVVGIILGIVNKGPFDWILCAISSVLMIASVFVKGL